MVNSFKKVVMIKTVFVIKNCFFLENYLSGHYRYRVGKNIYFGARSHGLDSTARFFLKYLKVVSGLSASQP